MGVRKISESKSAQGHGPSGELPAPSYVARRKDVLAPLLSGGISKGGHAPLRARFWLLFSRKKSNPSGARPRRRRKRKNPPAGGETRPNITAPPGGEGPRRTAIQVRRARRAGAGGGWEVREPPGLPAATSARCILCAPGQGGAPARPQPDGETRPSREKRRRKPW